jgi:F-type H+-transporting ATPase subunit epsilon
MRLLISEPGRLIVDHPDVANVRAEDESGCFGILPGHTDLLTVLPLSVVAWQHEDGRSGYCAIRRGVMTVRAGYDVSIAARQAQIGQDLERLEHAVLAHFQAEADAERVARVADMRLHMEAVRRIIEALRPNHARSGGTP